MILDRLILFLFGKGPKAEQEKAKHTARNVAAAAAVNGQVASGDKTDAAAGRKGQKRVKRKTPRKKIKKKITKKTAKKKSVKKKAKTTTKAKKKAKKQAKKTVKKIRKAVKKKAAKKAVKKAVKKIVKKIQKKKQAIRKKTVKKGVHRDIHVVFRREERQWALRREGMTRAWSLHNTQAEAILDARQRARRDKVEVIIHAKDGSIRDSDSSR